MLLALPVAVPHPERAGCYFWARYKRLTHRPASGLEYRTAGPHKSPAQQPRNALSARLPLPRTGSAGAMLVRLPPATAVRGGVTSVVKKLLECAAVERGSQSWGCHTYSWLHSTCSCRVSYIVAGVTVRVADSAVPVPCNAASVTDCSYQRTCYFLLC